MSVTIETIIKMNKRKTKKTIEQKKKEFLEALRETKGIISQAAKKVPVSRKTVYEWIKQDDDFRNDVDNVVDEQVDFVESKLLERIDKGDTGAIIFYLKTKGKKRGYSMYLEVGHKELNKIEIEVVDNASKD